MGERIIITSGKGGVGKTTTAACLGALLSSMGKRVLLVDGNFGLRNLDIALALENAVVFDLSDVLNGNCSFADAVLTHPDYKNLQFLATPQHDALIDSVKLERLLIENEENYDFIFIDSAAGVGSAFKAACKGAQKALIIVNQSPYSVRDAQRVSQLLEEAGINDFRLIVTKADKKTMRLQNGMDIDDIIDTVRVPFLGFVPLDKRLARNMDLGMVPFHDRRSIAVLAYNNIARRLLGEKVSLLKI